MSPTRKLDTERQTLSLSLPAGTLRSITQNQRKTGGSQVGESWGRERRGYMFKGFQFGGSSNLVGALLSCTICFLWLITVHFYKDNSSSCAKVKGESPRGLNPTKELQALKEFWK